MIARIATATVLGLDAEAIAVEADVSNGLPATIIVGLPDTSVQESRERVKSAIKNSQFSYPQTRVSVNLAPADLQKGGTLFDLPIALAVLCASQQLSFDPAHKLFVGELSLDGTLRPVPGVLAVALLCKMSGLREIFVPTANGQEAALVDGITVYPAETLSAVVAHLLGLEPIQPLSKDWQPQVFQNHNPLLDLKDIAGQETAKRALEVASAGGHNVLLYGPPGSGKTLLARAMAGVLPNLEREESLELTKIYSIAGKLASSGMVTQRPVRNPHHTTSNVALVGGGSSPRPGEITLAHRGILFLDEFPEFPRNVLEALRQPLEDGVVTVSRAKNTFTFPAKFILVAALNPCPCGYFGDRDRRCVCTPTQIFKYQKKISGPLLDRIDLHIEVPRLPYEKMMHSEVSETSAQVKKRVEEVRKIQMQRFGRPKTNSEMDVVELRTFCRLGEEEQALMKTAAERYSLSGRSIHRLLKVARTIADLDGVEHISTKQLGEAIQYRPKENSL